MFVDNGLLRENEKETVGKIFTEKLRIPLNIIDASERFLKKLEKTFDPEVKRKKIGEEFARVFTEFAEREGPFQWLAQGTLIRHFHPLYEQPPDGIVIQRLFSRHFQ